MRVLLIDNYDSFTFNLATYVEEITGQAPTVVPNDQPIDETLFDAVILSPGPGHPGVAADFGTCAGIIERAQVPILGVCLGHQGIAVHHGATIELAPRPVHGEVHTIKHTGSAQFAGIPELFDAVRYHSMVATNLPDCLDVTATTSDGLVMAFQHKTLPQWGVQFHPESIGGQFGHEILRNFLNSARKFRWTISERIIDISVDPAAVFETLFADSEHAFWLDDATGISYLGDASGPQARVVAHKVGDSDFLAWLRDDLAANTVAPGAGFRLGWVGYLGYEMKAECGSTRHHRSDLPDAHLIFADRAIAVEATRVRLLALGDQSSWLDHTTYALENLHTPREATVGSVDLHVRDSKDDYLAKIARAQDLITRGESYEICLTTQLHGTTDSDPFSAYLALRAANPTSYGAFLRFGDVAILSSSPERFITIDSAGHVQSKPIKGTRPRGATLLEDEAIIKELRTNPKDRAENLMIVDLVRNDLARGATPTTVKTSRLFDVETYATVHQLVSTISAHLGESNAIDCVRAAFPGGSMTGAPKLRTMEIIDELESAPRGIYSGGLGYFSLDGSVDLSMVIRTLVMRKGHIEYGVGGAILALSNPEEEWEEIRVKTRPLLNLFGVEFP
ncbi:PARA-aminobenzoate synthase component I and II [Corynebacterium deserti GIMN1.010]|uniref:aminodeoxychorismate synthase n=1 Tax=Corynebacterium deserti GIMN1.010 TaxID=931089 RepID=A0A0M4CIM8_9CORY|nr:aminodeoxychorismate synthase component I [Corynebacterium deserti]ALC05414.1 PARA-aminobenzoate synthase component I and II [Corynebacterium deserti GIMN1.010]